MNTHPTPLRGGLFLTVAATLVTVTLTGCGNGSPTAPSTTSSTSTTTTPSASTSTSTTTSSSPPTSSTASGATPSSATGVQRCRAAVLRPSIVSAGGAAGSTYLTVGLTNKGTAACTLRGFPGVSIVGHGNGTQIGAAAQRDTSVTGGSVTVVPGKATSFVLRVAQAGNYPAADCSPVKGDGFRIYPPDSTEALYLADSGVTGCAKTSVVLLTVRPMGVAAG